MARTDAVLLGIDFGSGGCKVTAIDGSGRLLGEASREYPTYYERPGWSEQEPADCARSEDCALRPVWQGLYRTVCAYLDGITLQTLLDRQAERRTDDYTI